MSGRAVYRLLQQARFRSDQIRLRCFQSFQAPTAGDVQAATIAGNATKAFRWGTLGFGLASAAAVMTTEAACAPSTPSTAVDAPPIDLSKAGMVPQKTDFKIVFVLGGPGSGKGTQCAKLVEEFGLVHLSAGDLLRAHMKSGTPDGNMVADMIKQGQIVPSRVTISLLEAAMLASGKRHFLIDGFPRNEENRAAFERQTGWLPEFVLFFDCPEAIMERRLLGRQEGRTDDNIETIRKRFKVFLDSTMPIIRHYEGLGRMRCIPADRTPDAIYHDVRPLFVDVMKS